MNPLTNVKNIQKLNQRELELGNIGKKSWHDDYKDSAWIFVGGLPYTLTEGDILCIFSQYGEIVNINLVRDKSTGKSKGFAFVCYEDQRSTVLAVDNLNSIKVLGRTIRVDHVADYKKPKEQANEDEITKQLRLEGCAPGLLQTEAEKSNDQNKSAVRLLENSEKSKKKKKKEKKKKKKKVKVTVKVEHTSESDSSSSSSSEEELERKKPKMARNLAPLRPVKIEKHDSGYDRALYGHKRDSVSDDRKQEGRTRDTQGSRERNGADASRSSREHSRERACHGSPEEVARHIRERHKDWRNHARDEKREHGSCGKDHRRDGEGGSRTMPGSSRDSWDRSSFSKRGSQRDDHSQRERHDYDRRDKR